MIGDDIVITVIDIRGDKVRLGIDAPQEIPVHRQEVYEAIQREDARVNEDNPDSLENKTNQGGGGIGSGNQAPYQSPMLYSNNY